MAEATISVAQAAVTSLLENLQHLVVSYVSSEITDVPERMRSEFRLVEAYLKDRQLGGLDLDRQFMEIVYEVDVTVESWLIQRDTARNNIFRGFLIRMLRKEEFARQMELINHKFQVLRNRIIAYGDLLDLGNHPTQGNQVPPWRLNKDDTAIGGKEIVGFEDEIKAPISRLMEETEELDVISITGMPGIGKTTLARKIFQNETVETKFPTRIWIGIHQDVYLLQILEKSSRDKFSINAEMTKDELIVKVKDYLRERRFLLFLDDLWSDDILKSVLEFSTNAGKVLITSCNSSLTRKPHMLRFLNEKESWDLLQLEVFGKLGACPQELISMGKSIAKSCEGLPLALVELANCLVAADSTEKAKDWTKKLWKEVSENVTMYLTDYGQHRLFSSLELSYIRLPNHLRNCFLYLGVFPEGDEIPLKALARLWIAEELVEYNEHRSLEESAEWILCDLINCNLVLLGKTSTDGKIKTCRLHKLLHGYCKHKAAEQDFYQEIKISQGGASDPNCRRLCVYSKLSEFLSSTRKEQRVHSMLCLKDGDKDKDEALQPKYSSIICERFKLLRVFECRSVSFTKFPTKLSKLIHLRYIALSCDDLTVIPESIASLRFLESLLLHTQSPCLVLKANIWMMSKLRHLITQAAIVVSERVRRGKGEAGYSLQTLTRLSPGSCMKDLFFRVRNLKTLGIRGQLADLSAAGAALRKQEHLENLKLVNESAAADDRLHRFLHPDFLPPQIRKLTLSATYLQWESMSVLGKIGSLEILKLKDNAFTGASWNTEADGFPCLIFLFISTTNLVAWEASADCLPSLKCLVLKNCEELEKIPTTLAKNLEKLDLEKVSQSAVESAREIERKAKGRSQLKLSIRTGSDDQA